MITRGKSTIVKATSEASGSSSSISNKKLTISRTSRNGRITRMAGTGKTNKTPITSKAFLTTGVLIATLSTGIGVIALSSSTYAEGTDIVDEVNITVPSSCSMTATGMNSHNDDIANGTYRENIGTTTIKAFCNDNAGFAIYATGYTGNEIGGTNSNKLVGTAASGNATIESGTATTAGNPDISNWAMKLAIAQDSGDTTGTNAFTIDSAPNVSLPSQAESGTTSSPFSQYHVIPNEYTKVAHKDTSTSMDETTSGASLATTYAAYISKTQPADTYSGQVKYTLVHPSTSAPSQLTPPTSCTTPVPGLTYMQDLTSSNKATILSNMTEDSQYYLADKSDDKTYCVAKLRDGNIWMTQNLDHDIKTDGSVIYDNTTTDLGWNGTSYDTASWNPERSTYTTGTTSWGLYNETTGEYDGDYHPESYDPGELYWNGTAGYYDSESDCDAAGGTWNATNNVCNQISSTGDPHFHLGNYYNWTATIAMNDSGYTADIQDTSRSICPTGWTLPKYDDSTSNGSFQHLLEQYGWNASSQTMENPNIWNTAISFSPAGIWGNQLAVGHIRGLWLSFVDDPYNKKNVVIDYAGDVTFMFGAGRGDGGSVRCIAR